MAPMIENPDEQRREVSLIREQIIQPYSDLCTKFQELFQNPTKPSQQSLTNEGVIFYHSLLFPYGPPCPLIAFVRQPGFVDEDLERYLEDDNTFNRVFARNQGHKVFSEGFDDLYRRIKRYPTAENLASVIFRYDNTDPLNYKYILYRPIIFSVQPDDWNYWFDKSKSYLVANPLSVSPYESRLPKYMEKTLGYDEEFCKSYLRRPEISVSKEGLIRIPPNVGYDKWKNNK